MAQLERTCRITGRPFTVSETEQFVLTRLAELNPALGDTPIPLPDVHPFESLRRIYSFGNLRRLYHGKSALSGAPQLTRYNPESGHRICTYDEFFSDAIDNTDHGRLYDFSRSFFEQFDELLKSVMLPPLNRRNCDESDFVNGCDEVVRSYLCFMGYQSRDCMYCLSIRRCTDCVDCAYCQECELCFRSSGLIRCYEVQESRDCNDSRNLIGCVSCRSCNDCFGCVGMDHASFCVFNNQLTPEGYKQFLEGHQLDHYSSRIRALDSVREFLDSKGGLTGGKIINCVNCSGAYLTRCENCEYCYNGLGSSNCGYLMTSDSAHYCFRGSGTQTEFCYMASALHCSQAYCTYTVFGGLGNIYSAFLLQGCSHCFGCAALRGKSYCILNQQFSKSEYFEIVPRIIRQMAQHGEWGSFFPPAISPHTYQESAVHEILTPIALDTARARGYRVVDEESEAPLAEAIPLSKLPQRLVKDDISRLAGRAVCSEPGGRPFNLQRKELEFYVKNNLPLPHRHWNERLQQLIDKRELIPAV